MRKEEQMANLVEQLLKADIKKADELSTATVKSKRLAKILGSDSDVEITVREIPARRINDIVSMQFDRKGRFDITKSFDAKALCCVEGIVEPDVKDKNLAAHFNCATPKDLVIKLFGSEITAISDKITSLSGVEADTEEEIKN